MSATGIRETIDREAAEAEVETPEPDTEPDTEPDDDGDEGDDHKPDEEPAQARQPSSERAMEDAFRKLDAEAKRHGKRVAEIMGDDFGELDNCPLCQIAGYVFPFQADLAVEEERRQATLAYFGETQPEYVEAPDVEACDECQALGKVRTGSRAPENVTKLCRKCGGLGFVPRMQTPPPALAAVPATSEAPGAQPAAIESTGPDLWGRPPGHPHYGLVPAMVEA